MSGDFSRDTFDRRKHYRAVYLQQGRLQLDADWNEAVDLELYRLRATAADVAGVAAAVKKSTMEESGFQVDQDLMIQPGRLYAGGFLCELAAETALGAQPDLPGYTLPTTPGRYVAYLDVWERIVTALEDPDLLEPALGGADTTVRTRVVCQVRLALVADMATCATFTPAWTPFGDPPPVAGQLRAQGNGAGPFPDQLYRVEIHAAGAVGTATFKWARDNASLAAAVDAVAGTQVTLADRPGVAPASLFAVGDWIEASDDGRVLRGEPGVLGQVTAVNAPARTLTVSSWAGGAPVLGPGALVRRWNGGVRTVTATGFLPLESGIEVEFAAGAFRTGDAWLVPSRATGLLWPGSPGAPELKGPDAIRHVYVPLSILQLNGAWSLIAECPKTLPVITEALAPQVNRGGDSMTGTLTIESDLSVTDRIQVGGTSQPLMPVQLQVSGGALQPDGGIQFANPPSVNQASVNQASLQLTSGSAGSKLELAASTNQTLLALRQGGVDRLVVNKDGSVVIGQPSPAAASPPFLDVGGQMRATGLQVDSGGLTFIPHSVDSAVLTSDETGRATWHPLAFSAGSPAFLAAPTEVTGGSAIDWTVFSLPAGAVPEDASAVILEAEAQETEQQCAIYIRKNSSASSLLLLRAATFSSPTPNIPDSLKTFLQAAGLLNKKMAWANQGIFPLDSGSFEYTVVGVVNGSWTIRAIGYFL
jgi:hypothetical protein